MYHSDECRVATPGASLPIPAIKSVAMALERTWPHTADESTVLHKAWRFRLPLRRTQARAPGVLIVDDDPQLRVIVSEILTFQGYVVWRATNGLEALAVLDHARPALAMVDLRMPGLDGPGFVRALEDRGLHLPVLVMTATLHGQYWAREVGAAGCLTKPFEMQDLLEQVERIVAPAQAESA
jgi:CheY-like chemotaxis protein